MGASGSRAVSIDNSSSLGVINVSTEVVTRLKDETAQGTPTSSNSSEKSSANVFEQPDGYFFKKWKEEEVIQKRTQELFEFEFNQSVENVNKQLGNGPSVHQFPPTFHDVKKDLIKCYANQLNLHETLKCSQHVQHFNASVSSIS